MIKFKNLKYHRYNYLIILRVKVNLLKIIKTMINKINLKIKKSRMKKKKKMKKEKVNKMLLNQMIDKTCNQIKYEYKF